MASRDERKSVPKGQSEKKAEEGQPIQPALFEEGAVAGNMPNVVPQGAVISQKPSYVIILSESAWEFYSQKFQGMTRTQIRRVCEKEIAPALRAKGCDVKIEKLSGSPEQVQQVKDSTRAVIIYDTSRNLNPSDKVSERSFLDCPNLNILAFENPGNTGDQSYSDQNPGTFGKFLDVKRGKRVKEENDGRIKSGIAMALGVSF